MTQLDSALSPRGEALLAMALPLASDLVRCRSVTPADDGALACLAAALRPLGFTCEVVTFAAPGTEPVANLWARRGSGGRHFCFAGHTDVVPPGPAERWSVDPFAGEVIAGKLFGRGAADMKGGIAAFVAAVRDFLAAHPDFADSISLLITGDEEGVSINGTKPLLDWVVERGERIDHCLVGEPTNPLRLGEMAKVGRRGSLNGWLTVQGMQGHVAYPDRADNPVPRLLRLLAVLDGLVLDRDNPHFQPSNLEIVTVDVGNPTMNLIPAQANAAFNVRFNDAWTGESLSAHLRQALDGTGLAYELELTISGESFLCPPGLLSEVVSTAVQRVTGRVPDLSTSGGTSDARFIRYHCPVIEFGLVGASMHKVDEHVALNDLAGLAEIYREMLELYFSPDRNGTAA